jgi:ATP synthase protein I
VNLFTSDQPVKQETPSRQVHSAVSDGWLHGGSFLNSILAGTLLGYLLDLWWGTEPWLVVTGIVLGSYSGFLRIWALIKAQDGVDRDH